MVAEEVRSHLKCALHPSPYKLLAEELEEVYLIIG
jgi:hypothetical protein